MRPRAVTDASPIDASGSIEKATEPGQETADVPVTEQMREFRFQDWLGTLSEPLRKGFEDHLKYEYNLFINTVLFARVTAKRVFYCYLCLLMDLVRRPRF